MKLYKDENNRIVFNKKTSVQLEARETYFYSPANKLVFVLTPLETSFRVTGYDLKGISKGSYEYKNAEFSKFCLRCGCANIVFCQSEADGKRCWYQGKLLDVGYITDLFALHRTDADGMPIAMVDEVEADEDYAEESVSDETEATETSSSEEVQSEDEPNPTPSVNLTKKSDKNSEVDDILASLTPQEASVLDRDPTEPTAKVADITLEKSVDNYEADDEEKVACVECNALIKANSQFCPICGAKRGV